MRALLLVLLLVAMACETSEVTTAPDAEQDTEEQAAPEAAEESEEEPPEEEPAEEELRAAVGDAITLRGTEDGLQVRVTVTSVIDPGTAGEFMEPSEGQRYVGVDLQLENVGTLPYDDSPDNGAQLIDQDNRQYSPTFAEINDCQTFGGGVTMSPGDTRAGCVIFAIPEPAALRSFQFTLDSGFAPQTGVWEF